MSDPLMAGRGPGRPTDLGPADSEPAEPLRLDHSLTGRPDAPVLILGNSLGTSRAVWDRQAVGLSARYRLLRYELPGHGGSPAPAGPYTIGQLGAAVLNLLDEHGIERAAYCGISLGAMIGMWLGAHAPGRIRALGLVCTSAFLPPAGAWRDRAGRALAGGMAPLTDQVVSRWFTASFSAAEPTTRAEFAAQLERIDPVGYAGCCASIATMDLRPDLACIAAPTLVIAGTEDPATPPWHGALIASAIKRARLRVIRGAAHLATVCAPGQVSTAIADHLRTSAA